MGGIAGRLTYDLLQFMKPRQSTTCSTASSGLGGTGDSTAPAANTGAYDSPFSGVGIPLMPLGVPPGHSGLLLHEVGFLEHNHNWNFSGICSPFWRMFHDFGAGHSLTVNGRQVRLDGDHWVVVPSYLRFDARGDLPVPTLWVHFSTHHAWPQALAAPCLLPLGAAERELSARFREAFAESSTSGGHGRVVMLGHAIVQTALARREFVWPAPLPARYWQLIAFIEAHCGEALPVAEIARHHGMAVSTLHRFIKQHTGLPLTRFINQIRTRRAASLLVDSHTSIDEIATLLGFGDRAYFTRVFTSVCGMPPADFRRKHRQVE